LLEKNHISGLSKSGMVPRGGIEPPTQGFSVNHNIEQGDK